MKRLVVISAVVLLVFAAGVLTGIIASRLARSEAIVTGAFRMAPGVTSGCSAYTSIGFTYNVNWTMRGQPSGVCVPPDSRCAKDAYVGRPLPSSCRGVDNPLPK